MGGNATVQFGTKRISKQEYQSAYHSICDLMSSAFPADDHDVQYGDIPYFADKSDFGDMDFLSTVPPQFFEQLIETDLAKEIGFEVVGKVKNGGVTSYALQYSDSNAANVLEPFSFQFDYIFSQPQDYQFTRNYFSYNDLGNLIGRVAAAYGYKFGFDGLFKKTFLDQDNRVLELSYPITKHNMLPYNHKIETVLTKNYDEALEFLGFDVERYHKGFNSKQEIFEFVCSSKFFDPSYFALENRNHYQRVRDMKRTTYSEFLDYVSALKPDVDVSLAGLSEAKDEIALDSNETNKHSFHFHRQFVEAEKRYPHVVADICNKRKQIMSAQHAKARLSKDKFDYFLSKATGYHLTTNKDLTVMSKFTDKNTSNFEKLVQILVDNKKTKNVHVSFLTTMKMAVLEHIAEKSNTATIYSMSNKELHHEIKEVFSNAKKLALKQQKTLSSSYKL